MNWKTYNIIRKSALFTAVAFAFFALMDFLEKGEWPLIGIGAAFVGLMFGSIKYLKKFVKDKETQKVHVVSA